MPVSLLWLLGLGIVFHACYLNSIFDIYFRSPLVRGLSARTPPPSLRNSPADRLVLIVADGLRADRFFEDQTRAPYLHQILRQRGRWGVSHTRVPTESRPGHVALIAGFYEDVSAVTKGWKLNPVEFDSVFNQSLHTWSFGSPDILPMFKHGASDPNKIEAFMYSAEEEDFSKSDAKNLDLWVFDRFEQLLTTEARKNESLSALLHQKRIIFFLHLLGLDTNGHAHWPHSPEYLRNIRVVDDGVRRVEKLINDFYGQDGKTAFVFTADHGMSNIGNHGDGNPDNTRTPLLVWGAGIGGPLAPSQTQKSTTVTDNMSETWGLQDLNRLDVNQADVAPLMASLIGISFPVNSVGVLPTEYLNMDDKFKASALLTNAEQVLDQYLMKESLKKSTEFWFRPFAGLNNATHHHQLLLVNLKEALKQHRYTYVKEKSVELMQLCFDGLRYFQTYDWFFLRGIVSSGYLGWMIYSSIFIIHHYVQTKSFTKSESARSIIFDFLAILLFSSLSTMMWFQHAPFMYYIYAGFAIFLWTESFQHRQPLINVLSQFLKHASKMDVMLKSFLFLMGMEILVLSYFRREVLGLWFLVLGWLWPLQLPSAFQSKQKFLINAWKISTSVSAVFMVLPIDMEESLLWVAAGGFSVLTLGTLMWYHFAWQPRSVVSKDKESHLSTVKWTLLVQIVLVAATFLLTLSTVHNLRLKRGLPVMNQLLGWGILALSLMFPVLYSLQFAKLYIHRLMTIFLMFAVPMIMLSVSYETCFYASFFLTLLIWLWIERAFYAFQSGEEESFWDMIGLDQTPRDTPEQTSHTPFRQYRSLKSSDSRIALLFLFFINCAFFGTGNVASVASFRLSSVYRLVTVFDPFLMGALLILKIMLPFFLLSSALGILAPLLDLPSFALFICTLATTDVMTLNFFFLVRDEGSWLEIGTSISHFVMACSFEVLSILLFVISWLLVGTSWVPGILRRQKQK